MGNCIALQKKAMIKIIKPDGEILEYSPPMKVCHVLSYFGGHAICDSLPVVQHLHPDTDMIGDGRVYYLLPLTPQRTTDKVREISSKTTTGTAPESGVLRIKLVISKQELRAMLLKGGVVTVDDMVSKLQNNGKTNYVTDHSFSSADGRRSSITRWMPMLESVPEGN